MGEVMGVDLLYLSLDLPARWVESRIHRCMLEMGPMDIIAVYLNVGLVVTLKYVVAFR
jgi:hypothetical protein